MTLTNTERQELEELREFKKNWANLTSVDYHSEDGRATLEVRGEFIKGMTIILVEWFMNDMKAENYTETKVYHPDTGMMIMTVQRVDGKTPHELKVEAEARYEQLLIEHNALSDRYAREDRS